MQNFKLFQKVTNFCFLIHIFLLLKARTMEIDFYLENKRKLQLTLLNFLDTEYDHDEYYQNLVKYFKDYKINETPSELKALLYLIIKISKNHQRSSSFFPKIEKIIKYFKSDILHYFSQYCLFNMFRNNKRILLFLIEEKMIIIDQNIADTIAHFSYKNEKYLHYFYPEIKNFISEDVKKQMNEEIKQFEEDYDKNFEEKRKIGENDNFICQLIRKDSIDEFISYINRQCWSVDAKVDISIYETNAYLYKINPTLIEYAAFFGSPQIFKYLSKNGATLTNNVWTAAVHGQNPEIFNLLEELGQTDYINTECLNESIKCHNIDVTNYFLKNYKEIENEDSFIKSIKYYNYNFFPNNLTNGNLTIFYELCKYNHSIIVESILKSQKIEFEANKILSVATNKNNKEIFQIIMRHKGIVPYSFYQCHSLTEISIPSSVKMIGDYAFANCTSLNQISIPFSVTSIGKEAFSMCISLKQFVMPSSVSDVGENCFYGCSSLKRISISSSMTVIKEETFYRCSSLQEISIPSSIKIIENSAFKGCSSLKQIKIPDSVIEIGDNAFCWCSSLVDVLIPQSVKVIGAGTFMVCSSLEKIEIPDSITSIKDNCFSFCESLEMVVIPHSVKLIGDSVFYGCSSLKYLTIPSNVEWIGEDAFYGCTNINVLPKSNKDELSKRNEFDQINSSQPILA